MKKIYTGKSKDVYDAGQTYILRFKDEMRAADGRFSMMHGKAKILATISSVIFKYLSKQGIPNHYIRQQDKESLVVQPAAIIPLECVVRRYAEGSFLKRNPSIKKHKKFRKPIFEIFYKDDSRDDPYVILDKKTKSLFLYKSQNPVGKPTFLESLGMNAIIPPKCLLSFEEILDQLHHLSEKVFIILENKFKEHDGMLCDLKLEFGFDGEKILLADTIEPDGWRLWYQDASHNLDRNDAYGKKFSKKIMGSVSSKYKLTEAFIRKVFNVIS